MTMIKFAVLAIAAISFASPARAQHNHIQSNISGQYGQLIQKDHDARITATENNKKQPKPSENINSSARPIIEPKNSN
jgi:hypothetical protein